MMASRMTAQATTDQFAAALEALRAAVKAQYHAALAMLRLAIERCPDDVWTGTSGLPAGRHPNPSWRIAYHALSFAHLYLQPTVHDFTPWERHQTAIQDLDDHPASPEIQALTEHPHRPPQTGVPYTKDDVLAYWKLCDDMIDPGVERLDLLSPESGFPAYAIPKLEHLLVNIRHIQHHAAQLGQRIREATAGAGGVEWVGSGRAPKRAEFPETNPSGGRRCGCAMPREGRHGSK